MYPYTYSVLGAVNAPQFLQVDAESHVVEDDKLLLTASAGALEPYLRPLEWWQSVAVGYTGYVDSSGSIAERVEFEVRHASKIAAYAYTVRSRHENRKAVVYADSHEDDGTTLRLLLRDAIQAVFDEPQTWQRKRLRYSDDEI